MPSALALVAVAVWLVRPRARPGAFVVTLALAGAGLGLGALCFQHDVGALAWVLTPIVMAVLTIAHIPRCWRETGRCARDGSVATNRVPRCGCLPSAGRTLRNSTRVGDGTDDREPQPPRKPRVHASGAGPRSPSATSAPAAEAAETSSATATPNAGTVSNGPAVARPMPIRGAPPSRSRPSSPAALRVRRRLDGRLAGRGWWSASVGPLSVLKFSLIFYFCVMLIVYFALADHLGSCSRPPARWTPSAKILGYVFGIGRQHVGSRPPITINGGALFTWLFIGGVRVRVRLVADQRLRRVPLQPDQRHRRRHRGHAGREAAALTVASAVD